MKKINLFKKLLFQHFWSSGKFFVFWQQSYARLAKTSFCMLDERFGEKQLCWPKFFIISGIRANGFENFDKKFRAGWSQPLSACPDEVFFQFLKERNEGKTTSFWKLRIAIIFRLWAKNIFSTFAGMVTAGLSKNRCTCSDEVFYKEIFWKAF